jgi:hypothetical protein
LDLDYAAKAIRDVRSFELGAWKFLLGRRAANRRGIRSTSL